MHERWGCQDSSVFGISQAIGREVWPRPDEVGTVPQSHSLPYSWEPMNVERSIGLPAKCRLLGTTIPDSSIIGCGR